MSQPWCPLPPCTGFSEHLLSSVSIAFCRGENERHRRVSGDQSPSELGSRVGSCLWEQGPLSPPESGIVPVSRRFQLTEVCLVSQPHAVSGGGGGFLISKPGLQQDPGFQQDHTTQTSQNDVTNWGPSVPKPERDVSHSNHHPGSHYVLLSGLELMILSLALGPR